MSKEPDNLVWLNTFKKSVAILIRQAIANNERIKSIGMTAPLFARYRAATNDADTIWGYMIVEIDFQESNPNDEQIAILGDYIN